jgi:hypothetical protein
MDTDILLADNVILRSIWVCDGDGSNALLSVTAVAHYAGLPTEV